MIAPDEAFRPLRRVSWMRLALLASLCLNVALAAYVGAQWLAPERPLLPAATASRLVEIVAARLPAADAERLRAIYAGKSVALNAAQAEYEEALKHAVDLLAQPTLDAAAFRTAVQSARDKRVVLGDVVIDAVVEAFAEMPARTRQELAGRLRRR